MDPWETDKSTIQAVLRLKERKEIPNGDEWRCGYLWKLLNERLHYHYMGNVDEEMRTLALINSLVVN